MIVQIFRETRPTAATNILQDNIDQIDNDNTLRSMFSGDSFPTNPAPVVGQPCYRIDLKKLFIYTADGWVEIMDSSGYNFLPIGVPIPVWDHLSVVKPPNSGGGAIYIKLTAGQSGPGGYNQGLLRNETVSGSAPLVTATAIIDLSDSPIYNQTVHLINTEEAFLRARTTSGELQMDQMQRITGKLKNIRGDQFYGEGMVSTESGSGGDGIGVINVASKNIVFDSANSPNARVSSTTSGETRSKNVSATWYLRIR